MAGDRKRFKRAVEKREAFVAAGDYSVPPEIGRTAIVTSFFTDEPLDTERGVTELESFRNEAHALADRVVAKGGIPELAIDATRGDIDQLIKDPAVSDMYVIGNGSLSNLILDERDYYDWINASDATDHLKLGSFIQRQCGGLTRATNVPLGLFVVSHPVNLHAALDDAFYPSSLDDPVNDKVQPIFTEWPVTYEAVKEIRLPEDLA